MRGSLKAPFWRSLRAFRYSQSSFLAPRDVWLCLARSRTGGCTDPKLPPVSLDLTKQPLHLYFKQIKTKTPQLPSWYNDVSMINWKQRNKGQLRHIFNHNQLLFANSNNGNPLTGYTSTSDTRSAVLACHSTRANRWHASLHFKWELE